MRFDPSVQAAVRQQTFPVSKRLGAIQTSERLLSRVPPLVYLQLAHPVETLAAVLAQQFLFWIVHLHVGPFRVDGRKVLLANLALEQGSCTAVILLVMLHQGLLFKFLPALVADVGVNLAAVTPVHHALVCVKAVKTRVDFIAFKTS